MLAELLPYSSDPFPICILVKGVKIIHCWGSTHCFRHCVACCRQGSEAETFISASGKPSFFEAWWGLGASCSVCPSTCWTLPMQNWWRLLQAHVTSPAAPEYTATVRNDRFLVVTANWTDRLASTAKLCTRASSVFKSFRFCASKLLWKKGRLATFVPKSARWNRVQYRQWKDLVPPLDRHDLIQNVQHD